MQGTCTATTGVTAAAELGLLGLAFTFFDSISRWHALQHTWERYAVISPPISLG